MRREDDPDDTLSRHPFGMPSRAVNATYLKTHHTATIQAANRGGSGVDQELIRGINSPTNRGVVA